MAYNNNISTPSGTYWDTNVSVAYPMMQHPTPSRSYYTSPMEYGCYNGQPFTMLSSPSPAAGLNHSTGGSMDSSGYASAASSSASASASFQTSPSCDLSPYTSYHRPSAFTPSYASQTPWYHQAVELPLLSSTKKSSSSIKPHPEAESIIRQIFDDTTNCQMRRADSKVSKPAKRAYQRKAGKPESQQLATTTITPTTTSVASAAAATTSLVDLGHLDQDDMIDFDFDDDDENETVDNDEDDDGNETDYSTASQQQAAAAARKKRVLTRPQRLAANVRERKRMNIMNKAFDKLKQHLPQKTGRKRRKMSRLDVVVGALEYITYLDELLKCDGPVEINFQAYLNNLDFY